MAAMLTFLLKKTKQETQRELYLSLQTKEPLRGRVTKEFKKENSFYIVS